MGLNRQPIHGRQGLVDAHIAQAAIPEGKADRGIVKYGVQQRQRLAMGLLGPARMPIQPRVIHGDGDAAGQLLGQIQVLQRIDRPIGGPPK